MSDSEFSEEEPEVKSESSEDEPEAKSKSRRKNRDSSDYEPDESELKSYGRRARKQARFDSSMFFDSEASSDDDWYDPKKRGGVRRGPPRERVNVEPVYSSDSDSLEIEEPEEKEDADSLPPKLEMMHSAWAQFITFSQFTATKAELEKEKPDNLFKAPWNPYKADIKKCQLYLKLLREKCKFGVRKVEAHYSALCKYLQVGLEKKTVDQLISACKLDLKKIPKRLSRRMDTYRSSISQKLWDEFCMFCYKKDEADPYLAQPNLVRDFLVEQFMSKDKFKQEEDRVLRPHIDFYTENIDTICKQLNFYLEFCYRQEVGSLIMSKEVVMLREVGEALDHREMAEGELGTLLTPPYWFVKYQATEHRKLFWRHGLVRRMMADISTGHLTIMQVAWQLGVSPDMISSVMGRNKPDQEMNFTIKQYCKLDFGTEEQYWQENSTMLLLEEVRERVVTLDQAAFQLGVSSRVLLEKVGEIKTEEQIKAEKEKKKKEEKQPVEKEKVKKLSALELQIREMEKNEDSLSQYERMRLSNMRERQMMVEMLNFSEDKEAMNELAPDKKSYKPKDYGVREKSSRIKRKVEEDVGKKDVEGGAGKGGKRQSPNWVGIWTPRTSERIPYSLQETAAMIPVPGLEIEIGDLVESAQDFHKASRVLQRLQAEVKEGEGRVERGEICWGEVEKMGESRVSQVEVMSVDCWGDMVCTGDMSGGVAVTLAGRTLGLKPHHLCVCRAVFVGGEGGLSVLSGSHDGTVRCTDMQAERVSVEAIWDRREVRWLEVESMDSCLVNLGGREVVRLDRREGGQRTSLLKVEEPEEKVTENGKYLPSTWTSVRDHPKVGSSLSLCPSSPHLMSLVSGLSVLVYDLRSAAKPLHQLTHQGGQNGKGWSGASWSKEGRYLLGCQVSGFRADQMECVVWDKDKLGEDSPVITWPPTQNPHTGASFSYYYGASWSPWQEGVFLTTARINSTLNKKVSSYFSVVAVDVTTNSVISELTEDLSYQTYCIASHPTRPSLVVANSSMPGMLSTYQYLST